MQLVRHYLESISNINIYPIIALVIFLGFFTVMVIHTLTLKKSFEDEAARLPLDDADNDENNNLQ